MKLFIVNSRASCSDCFKLYLNTNIWMFPVPSKNEEILPFAFWLVVSVYQCMMPVKLIPIVCSSRC